MFALSITWKEGGVLFINVMSIILVLLALRLMDLVLSVWDGAIHLFVYFSSKGHDLKTITGEVG